MKKRHLLVDLSSHGFGHFAQTSMVLNAIIEREPTLQITLRGTLPESIIRERLTMPVAYLKHCLDIGMAMQSAIEVDAEASYDYYQSFHADYQRHVQAEVELLRELSPDLLLANVPYISLTAAQALGIPSIAMCSLNWADIFQQYCHGMPETDSIVQQIRQAYSSAKHFLMVTPHMPMQGLDNASAIPPIAHTGQCQKDVLCKLVGNTNAKFVLVSLGGIPTEISTERWPHLENVYWLTGEGIASERKDVISQRETGLAFIDLLASCDAIITKTGYGTLVEAVASQTPVICVTRGSWPEEPALFDWVSKQGELQVLQMSDLEAGNFASQVEIALNTTWEKSRINCDGAGVAAEIILNVLNEESDCERTFGLSVNNQRDGVSYQKASPCPVAFP